MKGRNQIINFDSDLINRTIILTEYSVGMKANKVVHNVSRRHSLFGIVRP